MHRSTRLTRPERRASAVAGTVVTLALLAAATSADASGTTPAPAGAIPTDIEATLRIATYSDWGHMQRAAEVFNETYPNVEFEFQGIDIEYYERLPQTLATDDVPDVTSIHAERSGIWGELTSNGLVVDLTPVWEEEGLFDAYDPSSIDNFIREGVPMAIPLHIVWAPVIYYNEQMFADAGVAAPAQPVPTPEEWQAIVTGLTEAGHVPLVAGISDDSYGAFLLGPMLQTSCGTETYLNLIGETPDTFDATLWESDCAFAALQDYLGWAESGVFGDAPESLTYAQSLTLFASGIAGMIVEGSWAGFTPTWEADFATGWFLPPPVAGASEPVSKFQTVIGDGLAVPSHGDNVELALEFVKLIASSEFQGSAAWLEAPGPSPREDTPSAEGTPDLFASQAAERGAIGSVPMLLSVPYALEVGPLLARMVAGELTAAEAAAELAALAASTPG